MQKIMTLISHKGNENLIRKALSHQYEMIATTLDGYEQYIRDVDLLIIDTGHMDKLNKELLTIKQQDKDHYFPILLLTDQKTALSGTVQAYVDEILNVPVKKEEFDLRVKSLLHTRELFDRLTRLSENIPVGICILQQGKIKYFNPALIEILGIRTGKSTGTNAGTNTDTNIDALYDTDFSNYILAPVPSRLDKAIKNPQVLTNQTEHEVLEVKIAGETEKWCETRLTRIIYQQTPALLVALTDITERKKAEEKIKHISLHDELTGLYNRTYLEEEIKRLNTGRQLPISVIMTDLNGLKLVNDTYGHKTGDKILQRTGEILTNSCRQEDIVARWGGDEFVILLPQTKETEAQKIARRIKANCDGVKIEDIPISLAVGMEVKKTTSTTMEEIIKRAEDNMYKQKLAESRSARSAVLNTLLKTLQAKSYETEMHAQRMQVVAFKIAEALGLAESELNRLEILITLHDIGKINVPEETLTKEGSLTASEWEMIKKHPEIGYRITMATEEFSHVAEDILSHHERWDGSGYPRGLKGKEIPLLARITAIADTYDVMSNGRPYKSAKSKQAIIEEFEHCAGTQFDPDLVDIFITLLEEDAYFSAG